MDRDAYFLRHKCAAEDLNRFQTNVETMMARIFDVLSTPGVAVGGTISASGTPNTQISVAALAGISRGMGHWVNMDGAATLTLTNEGLTAIGAGGVPDGDAVPDTGDPFWITVSLLHARDVDNAYLDGLGELVYFTQDTGWRFYVVAGTAEASPTRPDVTAYLNTNNGVLLADIYDDGLHTYDTPDIFTDRRDVFSWTVPANFPEILLRDMYAGPYTFEIPEAPNGDDIHLIVRAYNSVDDFNGDSATGFTNAVSPIAVNDVGTLGGANPFATWTTEDDYDEFTYFDGTSWEGFPSGGIPPTLYEGNQTWFTITSNIPPIGPVTLLYKWDGVQGNDTWDWTTQIR